MPDPNASPDTVRNVAPASEERPKNKSKPTAPKEPKSKRFELYADTFAKGIAAASGIPCTPPQVRGPRDPLILLMRTHGTDENDAMLTGDAVLAWLEKTACEYRTIADPRVYAYTGWVPSGMARWLNEGRPGRTDTRGAAHIQVRRA